MDAVFKALADPTRRSLLDALYEHDGQTLSALEERLPMTRFGVMKHLRVLEEANLVTTKRRGREKLHFLNPVPIRLVHDRWVSKYAEPWAAALSGLKQRTGGTVMESRQQHREATVDGRSRREGVRDLHQDHPGEALGGDHRPGAAGEVHVRHRASARTGRRARATRRSTPPGSRSRPARTSRSIRRACSSRASPRGGATRSRRRDRRR